MNTELLKSKLLEAAFNGSLTHADTSTWEFPKIGDIAFTTSGGTPQAKNKEYYESGNIRWIRSGELGVKYIYDSAIKITQKALENSSAKYYPVDSVLIALYGATVGKVAILKAESTSNQAVCAIFPNERFTPEYMYYFLSSQRDNFLGIASGGAQSNISQEKVKNSIIPLPSIAEQQRIVAALEEGFAYIDAIAEAKENLSSTAEMLRSKILQAAFDGSLTGADTGKWVNDKLENICTILDGKRIPITKSHRTSGNIPYYGATGIVDYVKDYIFNEKLVLIGEDGAKWGSGENSAFIIEGKTWVNNHAHVVRPLPEKIIDEYLVAYLNHADLLQYVTGVTIPKLNQAKMRSIIIPLPPLAEQKRIVAKIEELFEQINRLSEAK